MFNRFTERARRVILLSREEAKRLGHDYLGTEHILLGLIREAEFRNRFISGSRRGREGCR